LKGLEGEDLRRVPELEIAANRRVEIAKDIKGTE
jgi:hypothetical protein